jgi:hypothetical protein
MFSGALSWVCPPDTRAHPLSLSMPFDCNPVARHSALLGRRPVPVWGWLCHYVGTEVCFGPAQKVLQIGDTSVPAGGRALWPSFCLVINLQVLALPRLLIGTTELTLRAVEFTDHCTSDERRNAIALTLGRRGHAFDQVRRSA